ncbi:hypothetical protein COO60DRAFT_980323 [Scenedesmus sp. NREL 46B-D3]|nr:hypothetical protein COO60DRAFT_980323 [Scenedesmus sp. NREL 46B-D3]
MMPLHQNLLCHLVMKCMLACAAITASAAAHQAATAIHHSSNILPAAPQIIPYHSPSCTKPRWSCQAVPSNHSHQRLLRAWCKLCSCLRSSCQRAATPPSLSGTQH